MDLIVRVKEIKGTCSVYKLGDTFKLKDGYRLVSEIPLCMHSLAAQSQTNFDLIFNSFCFSNSTVERNLNF